MKSICKLLVLLGVMLLGSMIQAATINVGPGEAYTTIQSAVTVADAGDTIQVAAGSYAGATITKSLILVGPNAGVAGSGSRAAEAVITTGLAIKTVGGNVSIDGFKFTTGAGSFMTPGTKPASTDILFKNNLVDSSKGVYTEKETNWLDVTFDANLFTNNGSGTVVTLGGVRHLAVTDNVFTDVGYSVLLLYVADSLDFSRNLVDTTGSQAINLAGGCGGGIIQDNVFLNINPSGGVDKAGVRFYAGLLGPLAITGNTFSNCASGIAIKAGENLDTTLLTITDNSFLNNVQNSVYNGSANSLDVSENYWGSPSGPDVSDIAGIGSVSVKAYYIDAPLTTLYPPVKNITHVGYYTTIQAAIDAATAGDTIRVAAGSYTEAVVINKAIDLRGANYNVSPRGVRRPESKIDKNDGNTLFKVYADGVSINGFEMTSPLANNCISHDNATSGRSNLSYTHNWIHDIGTANPRSGTTYAIHYVSRAYPAHDILIADNRIENVGNSANSSDKANNSAGIYFGDSASTSTIAGLVIERNTVSNIAAKLGWSGKIAWGIIIGTQAQVQGAIISNNEVSQINGGTARGIALEGNTPNALVISNKISDVKQAVRIENNNGAASTTLSLNSFERVTDGISNTATGTVTAGQNWWGNLTGPKITSNPGGTGSTASTKVNFSPWLGAGIDLDTEPVIGFQPNLEPLYYKATSLSFSMQPGSALLGDALSSQPTVTVINEINEIALQYTGSVTLAIYTSTRNPVVPNPGAPVAGVLNGTTSIQIVNGVAVFDGLSIGRGTGNGYQLKATASSLTAISDPFDILNSQPTLIPIGNQNVNGGKALNFTAVATDTVADLEKQTLTFSLTSHEGIPAGVALGSATGAFSWTPTESQSGNVYTFTVTVTDNGTGHLSASETFTVTSADYYDSWSEAIDWNVADSGRDDDPDADGLTNYEEFLAGTNPLNKNSALRISSIKLIGDEVEIRWPSIAGRVYTVEQATKLRGAWKSAKAGIVAESDETRFVTPRVDSGFFRVLVQGK